MFHSVKDFVYLDGRGWCLCTSFPRGLCSPARMSVTTDPDVLSSSKCWRPTTTNRATMYRSAQRTGRMTTSSVEIDVSFIKSRWRYSSSETADTWSLPNQESERCKSARTVTCVPPSEPNRHGRKIMQTRPRTRAQVLTPTAGNDFFFFCYKNLFCASSLHNRYYTSCALWPSFSVPPVEA